MIQVRRARAVETDLLTDLALRAKASWGYDAVFLDACRAELTMTAERLAAWKVWVGEVDGVVAGMIALSLEHGAEVEDFFVEPAFQGRGVGGTLMATLLDACRAAGATVLRVDADPNAEAIYARMGFVTVGRSPSGSIAGRFLPQMMLEMATKPPK